MWRGCVARARCDKLWLDKQVTVMQAFTRHTMAKHKVSRSEERSDEL